MSPLEDPAADNALASAEALARVASRRGQAGGDEVVSVDSLDSARRDTPVTTEAMRSESRSRPSLESPRPAPLRLLVTGGTGVLGRALHPLAEAEGHELALPARGDLDLFDPSAVADAVRSVDGVLHLATRIRPVELLSDPDAWRENDRLRADASRILVDAAIAAGVAVYVQPTVAFVYPPDGPVSEETPIGEVPPLLRSALVAEQQAERFARAGGRGVVLRLGLLDGPGAGEYPSLAGFGATLHVADAGRALLSALWLRSGTYNVCRGGERVSSERFIQATGWRPAA
jgi:nucleoside-diphosphate-sugar epimerase